MRTATTDYTGVVKSILENLDKPDVPATVAAFSPYVRIREETLGLDLSGHEGVRDFLQLWPTYFRDLRIREVQVEPSDRHVFSVWTKFFVFTPEFQRDMELAEGDVIVATYRPAHAIFEAWWRFGENHLITYATSSFDTSSLRQ